jgi:hypothetical protein
MTQNRAEQVLTWPFELKAEKASPHQELARNPASSGRPQLLYAVIHDDTNSAPEDSLGRPAIDCSKPCRRSRKRKGQSTKGGWQTTRYIDDDTYKLLQHQAHLLEREGYRLNIFATIHADRDIADDKGKKRNIELKMARLGQSLERLGQPYIALKPFEKAVGGVLHGHLLIYVADENLDFIKRWADRFDEKCNDEIVESVQTQARYAVPTDIRYVTKQHKYAGPYEKPRVFWEKGEPITGQRVSFTKTARAIIKNADQPKTALIYAAAVIEALPKLPVPEHAAMDNFAEIGRHTEPAAVVPSPPIMPAEPARSLVQGELQLVLLDDYRRPVARQIARLHDFVGGIMPPSVAMEVEHLRRRLGLTQCELARRAGISQPQLANVVAGRFGLAAWPAARLQNLLLVEAA